MKLPYIHIIALSLMQLITAFTTAPYSCDGGSNQYGIIGFIALLLTFTAPFFLKEKTVMIRIGLSVLFAFLSAVIWILGFAVSGHRLICKLF